MIGYVLRRLMSICVTFFVVSVLLFVMMHAIPGGPFDAVEMPLDDAVKAKIMARYGLDQPLYVQYLKYMWGVLHFDFGIPYQSPGETVLELLGRAWIPSLVLGGAGVLIGAPLGIALRLCRVRDLNTWSDGSSICDKHAFDPRLCCLA
jgi:ABC-type dipeptide/oligopeptide/nickel transport system permease component